MNSFVCFLQEYHQSTLSVICVSFVTRSHRLAPAQGPAWPTAASPPSAKRKLRSASRSGRYRRLDRLLPSSPGSDCVDTDWYLCTGYVFFDLVCRSKNETSYFIETLCHDPAAPLYGVMLDDYNSSTCAMKEKNTTRGSVYMCSCSQEEECNEKLFFPPSEYNIQLIFTIDAVSMVNLIRTSYGSINGNLSIQYKAEVSKSFATRATFDLNRF